MCSVVIRFFEYRVLKVSTLEGAGDADEVPAVRGQRGVLLLPGCAPDLALPILCSAC